MGRSNFSDGLGTGHTKGFTRMIILVGILLMCIGNCGAQVALPEDFITVEGDSTKEYYYAKQFKDAIQSHRPLVKVVILNYVIQSSELVAEKDKYEFGKHSRGQLHISKAEYERLMYEASLFEKHFPLAYSMILMEINSDISKYEKK